MTKGLAKHLGRTVAIGLLALGKTDTDGLGNRVGKDGQAPLTSSSPVQEGDD